MKMIDNFQGDQIVYHSVECAMDDPYN
jgi:hypothetical protein